MRRSPLTRIAAALVAGWFAISVAHPAWLRVCPLHDAISTVADGAAGHAGHNAHHDGHGAPESGKHVCQCVDTCCCTAVTLAALASHELAIAEVSTPTPGLPDYEYVAVARAHQLPFANGPPLA